MTLRYWKKVALSLKLSVWCHILLQRLDNLNISFPTVANGHILSRNTRGKLEVERFYLCTWVLIPIFLTPTAATVSRGWITIFSTQRKNILSDHEKGRETRFWVVKQLLRRSLMNKIFVIHMPILVTYNGRGWGQPSRYGRVSTHILVLMV